MESHYYLETADNHISVAPERSLLSLQTVIITKGYDYYELLYNTWVVSATTDNRNACLLRDHFCTTKHLLSFVASVLYTVFGQL